MRARNSHPRNLDEIMIAPIGILHHRATRRSRYRMTGTMVLARASGQLRRAERITIF